MNRKIRIPAALLLLAVLLTACSGTAAPKVSDPAAPAAGNAASPTASVQATGDTGDLPAPTSEVQTGNDGKEQPPTQPADPDSSGYEEYARRFFQVLKKGDAFAAASYIWFENDQDRDSWVERFEAPYNATLGELSCVSRNLWAATVEENHGPGVPASRTVYYVAWYDGSYRIFADPSRLPADLLRDRDYSGMSLPEEKAGNGKKANPDGDEFPPEDGQAEKWYRERQAELAAVRAAAEQAVRALPEAKTVKSFDDPSIKYVEASKVDFIKVEPKGSKLLLYEVSYATTADELLGPIIVYLDTEANVLGFAPRE